MRVNLILSNSCITIEELVLTERLLQYIWQFQYFNSQQLKTSTGEQLQILNPGYYNTNQGPDFFGAHILIDNTEWFGTIELHTKASDWYRHHHEKDQNYRNVILHVVWEEDRCNYINPVLELQSRVPKFLLERYEEWMQASAFVPCAGIISKVPTIVWENWKARLIAERLLLKAESIANYLKQSNFHWEEVFWWLLARNFGLKVNADSFEAIARSLPLTVLAKQKHQVLQLEALLFGQAGLLQQEFTDHYPKLLQKEYRFQQAKHGLEPLWVPLHFLRMRPGNFPSIRLAQLAMLIHGSMHLFTRLRDAQSLKEVRGWFDITANDYWHYHYRFDEESRFMEKRLGQKMIDTIIINTVVPVLFAYGEYHRENRYKDKAVGWLEQTPAELNSITNGFIDLQVSNKTAYDSQALIQLKSAYCDHKKCLDCAIGNALLKEGGINADISQ